MTASREEDERASGNHEVEPKARPASGHWDPLASFRKTISPTQRMELLSMKVPVLPPEDFMDTADFERARAARSRRFMPLVFGLGGVLLVLLFVGLWSRFWSMSSHPMESTRPPIAPKAVPTAPSPAHVDSQASPTSTTAAASIEPPASTKPAAKSRPLEATPKSADPSPPSVPRSKPAPPQPKTSTPSNPEPAPSGINFWTQPR